MFDFVERQEKKKKMSGQFFSLFGNKAKRKGMKVYEGPKYIFRPRSKGNKNRLKIKWNMNCLL